MAAMIAPLNANVETSGLTITDHEVPGPTGAPPVRLRVYTPATAPSPTGRPALLDIHGGGFVVGSIEMEHAFAAHAAHALDAVIVAVEYRLAPEHPFPAGLEDCYAALTWMHGESGGLGIDTTRVGVGGQSAGGGLSAATALLARDRGGPPLCFQFLGIPELDHRLETASMRAFVDTPIWTRPAAELSWSRYLGDDPGEVSPYRVTRDRRRSRGPAARVRHDDGVRSAARRRDPLRAAHDGGGCLRRAALLSGHVPRLGAGDDRRGVAASAAGAPRRAPPRPADVVPQRRAGRSALRRLCRPSLP